MFKQLSFAVLTLIPFAVTPNTASAQTITDIVSASGGEFDNDRNDFDILLTAVVAADLAGTLATPDLGVTVFAPTDRAFIRLARDLGFEGNDEEGAWNFLVAALTDLAEDGDPIPVLTNVLLYHVAPGNITRFGLILRTFFGSDITTLLDGATFRPFFFWLIDNDPDIRNPRVIAPRNLEASNGLIQGINRVLVPLDL